MARFMFVYRNSQDAQCSKEDMSPEQMQESMAAWGKWMKNGFEKGWLVDPGDALKPDGKVINDQKVVSDGPFMESKEIVGGFMIVEAADIDAACEIAKDCPGTNTPGCTVEVRELAGMAPPKE